MGSYKKIVFVILFALLFLPVIQKYSELVKERPLQGAFTVPDSPVFCWHDWFNGHYQDKVNDVIEKKIGFHNSFVRIRNQIRFSLFGEISVHDQIAGKNHYWFSENWINHYLGKTFSYDSISENNIQDLEYLKQHFESRHKLFLTVITPTKSSFIPEYFPSKYQKEQKGFSYYDYYKNLFDSLEIRYIDFDAYFSQIKDTSRYPLFTYTGCHWSNYGAVIVLDSILGYMENYFQRTLPVIEQTKCKITTKPQKTDNDIEKAMNLMFSLKSEELAYPELNVIKSDSTFMPKVIVIGDSFYWVIIGTWVLPDIFTSDSWFWYYFKTAYPNDEGSSKCVSELDVMAEVESADVIMFLSSNATLESYPYGFAKKYIELSESYKSK